MRKIIQTSLGFCLFVVLVSCASGKPATTASKVPVPEFRQLSVWKVTSIETSYPDGILSSITTYDYDSKGNLLKEEQFNGSRVLQSRKVYVYKFSGDVEITVTNAAAEISSRAVRSFSGEKILSETVYNPRGEVQSSEEYTYNDAGEKVRWLVKTSSGNQMSSDYTWVDGRLTGIVVRDVAGNPVKRYERTWNSDGVMTREDAYDAKGTLFASILYMYEGKFLIREENRNPAGALVSSIKYTNDTDGNPVGLQYLDRNGRLLESKTQKGQIFTRTIQVR